MRKSRKWRSTSSSKNDGTIDTSSMMRNHTFCSAPLRFVCAAKHAKIMRTANAIQKQLEEAWAWDRWSRRLCQSRFNAVNQIKISESVNSMSEN